MKNWKVLSENEIFTTLRGMSVSTQRVELPDGKIIDDYYQITIPSYTVVYALTNMGLVVCLRQYKHGARRVGLTLPGGMIDPGETPLKAAQRELLEETGYVSPDWRELGSFVVNGNQRVADAHLFAAFGATKLTRADPGDLEEMAVELLGERELAAELAAGNVPIISHCAAIGMVKLCLEGHVAPVGHPGFAQEKWREF